MWRVSFCLATATLAAGCAASGGGARQGATIVQPGAPGQETREISAAGAATLPQPEHNAADVRFMVKAGLCTTPMISDENL